MNITLLDEIAELYSNTEENVCFKEHFLEDYFSDDIQLYTYVLGKRSVRYSSQVVDPPRKGRCETQKRLRNSHMVWVA